MPSNQTSHETTPEMAPSEPSENFYAYSIPRHSALRHSRKLIGSAIFFVCLIAILGLIIAYVPKIALRPTETQTAAAATTQSDYFKDLSLNALGVYVFDVTTDKELFTKNAEAQLPLASITKIMLVLAVSEVLPLDGTVTISRSAVQRGGGGLTLDEVWNTRDLIDFTLITSSNTGAIALGEAADALLRAKYPDAPENSAAVWRMNALARELGMNQTFFINESGLDESATQAGAMSSAHDVAKMFEYVLRTNRNLFSGTARTDVQLAPSNFHGRDAINTNDALRDIPDLIMGKTGTTDLAGGNLAIAFNAVPDHPVIIVVLGSTPEGRFADIKKLVATTQETISAR